MNCYDCEHRRTRVIYDRYDGDDIIEYCGAERCPHNQKFNA